MDYRLSIELISGYGVAFTFELETNPISSGNEDYGIILKVDPLEISYHQVRNSKTIVGYLYL